MFRNSPLFLIPAAAASLALIRSAWDSPAPSTAELYKLQGDRLLGTASTSYFSQIKEVGIPNFSVEIFKI
jgi:hypothetical protein